MNFLAAGIIMLGAALGAGFGMCYATSKAVDAVARQPEAASNLRTNMILGCAVTETTGIYALVISLLILFAL